jgi:site-specific DNA-cytosine methylase
MVQKSILDFVSRKRARVVLSGDEKPKFVDLFCGIGGASEGAAMAGYDVVLAVDNWEVGIRYIYYGPDACCNPVSGPSHTILAGIPLRWATPPTNGKYVRFTPTESAAVQCFPPRYILPKEPKLALRGVGNAIPPSIMKQLLTEGRGREPLERASASD